MDLTTIVTTVNTLVSAATQLGLNFQDVVALQRQAEEEGRELEVEDFKKLRDGARAKLDNLDAAIRAAEEGNSSVEPPTARDDE